MLIRRTKLFYHFCDQYSDHGAKTQGDKDDSSNHKICKNRFQLKLVSIGQSDLELPWTFFIHSRDLEVWCSPAVHQKSRGGPEWDSLKSSLGPPNNTEGQQAMLSSQRTQFSLENHLFPSPLIIFAILFPSLQSCLESSQPRKEFPAGTSMAALLWLHWQWVTPAMLWLHAY